MLRKFIKLGLSKIFAHSNVNNIQSDDVLDKNEGVVSNVYSFADFLCRRFNVNYIIDIGCGRANKINVEHSGQWIEWDLEKDTNPPKKSLLKNSVIICADVIEHIEKPRDLLKNVKKCLNYASVAIITTPDRDMVRGVEDFGSARNKSHVREWNLSEMEPVLKSMGFNNKFCGFTNNNRDLEEKTAMFVLGNNFEPEFVPAPNDFKVVAIMTAYNEEDIIVPSISRLIKQGIEVYLIDNWSTDATYECAHQLLGKGLIGIERFPVDGPSKYYDWENLLGRVEMLASEIHADWFIHHDVDEIRESPWPDITLKDAFYYVDRLNFNAIDHTVIVFQPVDDDYLSGSDYGDYYSYFEFGKRPGHFVQIKAWKNLSQQLSLRTSGGHEVRFDGRHLFPYKFLLRHYPIRSQKHGEKKVFLDRKLRLSPKEREKGWHFQYDSVKQDNNFIKNPHDLIHFQESSFYRQYLVERLSGIGIIGSSGK